MLFPILHIQDINTRPLHPAKQWVCQSATANLKMTCVVGHKRDVWWVVGQTSANPTEKDVLLLLLLSHGWSAPLEHSIH